MYSWYFILEPKRLCYLEPDGYWGHIDLLPFSFQVFHWWWVESIWAWSAVAWTIDCSCCNIMSNRWWWSVWQRYTDISILQNKTRTDTTRRTGTVYISGVPESTTGFIGIRIAQSLVYCMVIFVFFCHFSFAISFIGGGNRNTV